MQLLVFHFSLLSSSVSSSLALVYHFISLMLFTLKKTFFSVSVRLLFLKPHLSILSRFLAFLSLWLFLSKLLCTPPSCPTFPLLQEVPPLPVWPQFYFDRSCSPFSVYVLLCTSSISHSKPWSSSCIVPTMFFANSFSLFLFRIGFLFSFKPNDTRHFFACMLGCVCSRYLQ